MKKHISLLILIMISINQSGCIKKKSSQITGTIRNLPDGKIFLIDLNNHRKVLDSASVEGGKFEFNTNLKQEQQYTKATVILKDEHNITHEFSYPTAKTINGNPNTVDYFLLEKEVHISGYLKEFKPKNFTLPANLKIQILSDQINGRQSWVAYNVDLKESIKLKSVGDTIKKYPYSYYLLSEVNDHINQFSNAQLKELLVLFDTEIQDTPLWVSLNNVKRGNNDSVKLENIMLPDSLNKMQQILNTDRNKINILVFWASWCGPCIKEIPDLKTFFNDNMLSGKINMVSISSDKDVQSWKKALRKEKMPWRQLIFKDNNQNTSLFYTLKLDSYIPAVAILDNNGKILATFQGYDPKSKISENLKKFL